MLMLLISCSTEAEDNKCKTETALGRTLDCKSVGQSDQESVVIPNTVKRKVMALEAGMSTYSDSKDITNKEPHPDTEFETLPSSRHSSLGKSSGPASTIAPLYSESEMDFTTASHDHLESTEVGEDEGSVMTATHTESNDQSGWTSTGVENTTKADYTTSYYSDEETYASRVSTFSKKCIF